MKPKIRNGITIDINLSSSTMNPEIWNGITIDINLSSSTINLKNRNQIIIDIIDHDKIGLAKLERAESIM